MNPKDEVRLSKFLSLVLRHTPEKIHLPLDAEGWVAVSTLIENAKKWARYEFSLEDVYTVVKNSDKQRFALKDDNTKIRANQGHSIATEIVYPEIEPPEFLLHGTVASSIPLIKESGLLPMNRQYVHLSRDVDTARVVGSRRGAPIILRIHAGKMYTDGYLFYCSENAVWLTKHVPSEYIDFP